jgi:hypothetical protein
MERQRAEVKRCPQEEGKLFWEMLVADYNETSDAHFFVATIGKE